MLAQSGWRTEMLLNIHSVQGGPTRIIWLKMSTVPRLKKKKTCFTPYFLKFIISWSETVRGTYRAQSDSTYTDSVERFPQKSPHLFLKHHEALFVFTIQITSLLCHGTSEPFPSVSGVSTSFTVVMTAFLPSLRPQSVSLWSLKSNVIGLNCLSTPPLLLLASPFNSLSDSIPPHFYYSLTEVNVLPLIYLGTLNNTPQKLAFIACIHFFAIPLQH